MFVKGSFLDHIFTEKELEQKGLLATNDCSFVKELDSLIHTKRKRINKLVLGVVKAIKADEVADEDLEPLVDALLGEYAYGRTPKRVVASLLDVLKLNTA